MHHDRIDAAIAVAARAPSAYNTQPWQVRRDVDQIVATVDPSRILPLTDPTHRDTLLGMGCWVECLAIALESAVAVTVTGRVPDVTVQVTPVAGPRPGFTVEEVLARQVDRGRLRPDPAALDRAVHEFSRQETGSHLSRVDEKTWRRARNHTALGAASPEGMLRERLDWLRLDPAHSGYHRDGLNAECLRVPPRLGRIAARILASGSGSRRGLAGLRFWRPVLSRLRYSRAAKPPARLALAAEDHHRPADLIRLGRELLRCWLQLGRQGLKVSVHSEIRDDPATAPLLPAGTFAVFSAGRSTGPVPYSARLE